MPLFRSPAGFLLPGLLAALPAPAAPPNTAHTKLSWSEDMNAFIPVRSLVGAVGAPAINDTDEVAFPAESGVYQGAWWESVPPARVVARVDGLAGPEGEAFASFSSVIYSNHPLFPIASDRVLFHATLATGSGGVTSANNEGYWLNFERTGAPAYPPVVAREGKPVPGASPAVYAAPFAPDSARLGNNAVVSIRANTSGGPEQVLLTGVPSPLQLQLVAKSGQQWPGLAAGMGLRRIDPLALTSAGSMVFSAEYGESAGQQFTGSGVWSSQSGSRQNLFLNSVTTGAPAGYNIQAPGFREIGVNRESRLAFRQLLTDPFDGTDTGMALFSSARNTLQYETGYPQAASGLTGLTFATANTRSTVFRPLINNERRIGFQAYLEGPGVTPQNDSSLWMGIGTHFTMIARAGDQAPGLPDGVKFGPLDGAADTSYAPSLSSTGHLVFLNNLTGTGITASNDSSIWMTDHKGQLRLLAREGDTLEFGITRTYSEFTLQTGSGGDDGRARCVSASGRVAFKVRFTTGDSAIVTAKFTDDPPPVPSIPTLSISAGPGPAQITLSWTTIRSDCRLQASRDLAAWTEITNAPAVNGYTRTVVVDTGMPQRFFRIYCP